uniref:F-box domain-containing protein n=1 Tax=Glossina brevipalpis TaxID=37001 RepID=A0A1A9W7L6_9MUSC
MNRISQKWGELPTLVLGQIYEYLEPRDRLNASLACKHWRSVLFQKRFFTNFKLKLHVDNDRQCKFFRHTLHHLTSELTIIFDFLNVFHIEKIRRILYKIARCDNVQGLRFQTNSVGLVPPGDISEESLVDIEHRPQDLKALTLASIKYDPSHYPMFSMENTLLQKCSTLQVLSLDYDTLTEELLHAIEILPLKKFLISVHGLDRHHRGISERAWSEFSANFNNIELIVSLIYAFEAVEVLQMNVEALEWMSINNNNTLKSIQWIDSAYKHSDKNIMDLFLRSGQDPFVMMSWRCKNLEEIVIHGYVLDPHNIVGISRLRGRTLKRLEVSMVDSTPTEASMDSFVEEINTLLGQKWEPLNLNDVHPALGYMPVPDDVRDEYVFDLIRRDISN